jgi:hypothetical protein
MENAEPDEQPPPRNEVSTRRPRITEPPRRGFGWLFEPRSAVLTFLVMLIGLGVGRRWYQSLRARRAVDRLSSGDITPKEIEEIAAVGRDATLELFRLLGTGATPEIRQAAGRALAKLWKDDQLVAEEEKAIVTRGFLVTWRGRRRYPRAMQMAIPFEVSRGVPFLCAAGDTVCASNLEWCHRVLGTHRASLESYSEWTSDPSPARFAIEPADFSANGPHRLIFHAKARTKGLTSAWEIDLPQVPFSFEFDPILAIDALLATPDAARGDVVAKRIRLLPAQPSDQPRFWDVTAEFAIRDLPVLELELPLPTDVAHAIFLEIDGVDGRIDAGSFVLSGQTVAHTVRAETKIVPLALTQSFSSPEIERPGTYQLRAVLEARPELGWTDPDVRSVWPGNITTNWVEVEILRR